MSEQWKGLHYHDRHVTAAPFGRRTVGTPRYSDWKKRALAAEAQVQAVREADRRLALPGSPRLRGGVVNPHYDDGDVTVYHGDCLDVLRGLPDASVDAVVTDPPYELLFMSRAWDGSGIAYNVDMWRQCLRVLKPGGHLLAFGGTRTYHRMACAIEDAGFEIRDSIHWTYGSGFPKSLDVSKAIDKAAGAAREVVDSYERKGRSGGILGAEVDIVRDITAPATDAARQWDGWGTALKPSHEPIVVARKPLVGTVAGNVLAHGTGAINIDGCRVGTTVETWPKSRSYPFGGDVTYGSTNAPTEATGDAPAGRWPANTILTHAPDCDPDGGCGAGCPCAEMDAQSGVSRDGVAVNRNRPVEGSTYNASAYNIPSPQGPDVTYGGEGGASRFFPAFYYTAKASSAERPRGDGVAHPTVKPLDLMRWLVRLVTPPGGVVLEPFAGSGTTAEACVVEGFRCIAIEREADYLPLIEARLSKPIERTLL